MATINEAFGDLGLTITKSEIFKTEQFLVHFLLRGTHPLTFNGIELGVYPVSFTTADMNSLFGIFGTSKATIEHEIKKCPSIDRSYIVTSDPFNLLCVWLVHLAPIYIKDKKVCYEFSFNILKLMLLKIFTSVVNHNFRYGANEGVMQFTITQLTKKSDVVRMGSWNALIDSHVAKLLDPNDRFYKTLLDGSPDELFLRVVGEAQTALRAKIVTFVQAYYEAYTADQSMGSRSTMIETAEGERIIAQTASVIESATQSMVAEILNPNMFIHDLSVTDIANGFTTISPRMLKNTLLRINETAVLQAASRKFDYTENTKDGMVFVGVRVLIMETIRSMVSMSRRRRVNMASRAQLFEVMKDAYASSRSLDPDILAVKRSVAHLIDPFKITVNIASQSALRLAVIYYILYRTIQKL